MTKRECAIVSAYTGILMLSGDDIDELYSYVSDLMDRPVLTHEFMTLADLIKELSKPDFIDLCRNAGTVPETIWNYRAEGDNVNRLAIGEDTILTINLYDGFHITDVSGYDNSNNKFNITIERINNDNVLHCE